MKPDTWESLGELLTIVEAAQYLRTTVGTVRRWKRDRGLPCVKPGGRVLFPRKLLEGWLRDRATSVSREQMPSLPIR